VPTDGTPETARAGVAEAGAVYIERLLRSQRALVMALGTGRAMRASVERVAPMSRSLHRLVSLVGNISPDGSASPFDALVKLAEITGAQHFPMPLPLHAATAAQRDLLLGIPSVRRLFAMANRADAWMMGIGGVDRDAVLIRDGFVTRGELLGAMRAGGVGEITGCVFDAGGRVLDVALNARLMSVPLQVDSPRPRICIAHGSDKVIPLRAALTVLLVNGLVTDETTAHALLAPDSRPRTRRKHARASAGSKPRP